MFKLYKFDVFSPLHFTLIMVFFYTVFKYFLMYLGLSKNPLETFQSTDFVTLLIIVQFILIFCFYNIFKIFNHDKYLNFTKRYFSFEIDSVKYVKFTNFTIIILAFLLYETHNRLIGISFLQLGDIRPVDIKLMHGNNPMSYVIIKGFAENLLLTWTFVLAYFVIMYKKYWFQIFLLILLVMFLSLYNGSRGMFVMGTLFPLLITYNAYKKRLSLLTIFIFFILVIFVLGFLGILRDSNDAMSINTITDIIYNMKSKISYIFLSVLDRRMDSFYPNLMYIFDNIEKIDLRYGFDYVNIFLQFIPRSIWDDKPLTLVREVNNILVLQSVGNTGFSSIFEAWINFGVFGLVFNAIMASFLLVVVQKIYTYARHNHHIFILKFAVTTGTGLVMRFFISPGITHNSVEIVFQLLNFVIAVWLIKTLTYRKIRLK